MSGLVCQSLAPPAISTPRAANAICQEILPFRHRLVVFGPCRRERGCMKIILLFLLPCAVSLLMAQNVSPANHDFDFWVGDWEVTNQANGKLAGHNRVELKHAGRVLVKNYPTPGAYTGMSVNGYDGVAKRWHQCWMDSTGGVLDLYGGLEA